MELVRYGFSSGKDMILCSRTDAPKLQELGVSKHILMRGAKGDFLDKFLFPEFAS